MSIALVIAGILACVLLSGFFSGSEMAYSSCNQLRLEKLRDDGSRRAGIALRLCERYLFCIAERDLVKVVRTHLRVLSRHLMFLWV